MKMRGSSRGLILLLVSVTLLVAVVRGDASTDLPSKRPGVPGVNKYKGLTPAQIKERFDEVMKEFEDKESVQICIGLLQRIDQKHLHRKAETIEGWSEMDDNTKQYVGRVYD